MTPPDKTRELLLCLAVFVVALLILFSRRPDAFTNPQFWAEDGTNCYQQAYNDGVLKSLIRPEAGYFQTSSRVVAAVSQMLPLSLAPAAFNAAAIACKIIVVFFLLSDRLPGLLPTRSARLLAAFIYLAMPHSYETHANLANSMWQLGLLCCLIVMAAPAVHKGARVFDYFFVTLSAISGPFCLFLAPLAGYKFYRERDPRNRNLLLILGCGFVIQFACLLLSNRASHASLGASAELFFKIVGGHWFVNAIVGEVGLSWLIRHQWWSPVIAALVNLTGFGLLIYAAAKAKTDLRLLIAFACMLVFAALASPIIAISGPQWSMMWLPTIGARYWLVPVFCFLLMLLWLARHAPAKAVRAAAAGLLLASCFGAVVDWRYPPYKDLAFQQRAAEFSHANAGDVATIPINPDWQMQLRKK